MKKVKLILFLIASLSILIISGCGIDVASKSNEIVTLFEDGKFKGGVNLYNETMNDISEEDEKALKEELIEKFQDGIENNYEALENEEVELVYLKNYLDYVEELELENTSLNTTIENNRYRVEKIEEENAKAELEEEMLISMKEQNEETYDIELVTSEDGEKYFVLTPKETIDELSGFNAYMLKAEMQIMSDKIREKLGEGYRFVHFHPENHEEILYIVKDGEVVYDYYE